MKTGIESKEWTPESLGGRYAEAMSRLSDDSRAKAAIDRAMQELAAAESDPSLRARVARGVAAVIGGKPGHVASAERELEEARSRNADLLLKPESFDEALAAAEAALREIYRQDDLVGTVAPAQFDPLFRGVVAPQHGWSHEWCQWSERSRTGTLPAAETLPEDERDNLEWYEAAFREVLAENHDGDFLEYLHDMIGAQDLATDDMIAKWHGYQGVMVRFPNEESIPERLTEDAFVEAVLGAWFANDNQNPETAELAKIPTDDESRGTVQANAVSAETRAARAEASEATTARYRETVLAREARGIQIIRTETGSFLGNPEWISAHSALKEAATTMLRKIESPGATSLAARTKRFVARAIGREEAKAAGPSEADRTALREALGKAKIALEALYGMDDMVGRICFGKGSFEWPYVTIPSLGQWGLQGGTGYDLVRLSESDATPYRAEPEAEPEAKPAVGNARMDYAALERIILGEYLKLLESLSVATTEADVVSGDSAPERA